MGFLRRGSGAADTIATAVLNFYADDDGELQACEASWVGDERIFLLLPGMAIDEYLPYVRMAHGKLGDAAKQAVLDEVQGFVEKALEAVEQGAPPPLWNALPLVMAYPDDIAAQATISIRFSPAQERLWADTAFVPKNSRDVLFFIAPRICWDWVFTALTDDRPVAEAALTDFLLLCDDYREHGIPSDFSLKGIGRAPYRLWVEDDAIEDLRETAERNDRAIPSIAATPSIEGGNGRGREEAIEPLRRSDEGSGSARLSAELFDQDEEHEGYWAVVTEVMRFGDRHAIPEIARQMSLNSLRDMLRVHGIDFERSIEDLAESFADAWLLADAEDWQIDPASAETLIDECMRNINRSRLAVGSDTVDRSDYSTWISLVLLGLHSDADEWEPLNSYVRSEGAWERLEWVFPTYLSVGEHLSKPQAAALEGWRLANELAWRNGILLSLLFGLGFLSTEAGGRAFADGERPLSGTLFEVDPEQYQLTAAQLTQATAQAVPEVAKQLCWHLLGAVVDEKLARDYGQWLQDTFECGYVLCVSETWDGIDEARLRALIDEGLRNVIAQKGTGTYPAETLIGDTEYRIRNPAYGIAARMPYFAALTAYLDEQDALDRIGVFGGFMLTSVLNSGAIRRGDAKKLDDPLHLAFMLGVAIAILDQLGEVPATMPEKLP
jgi:hypothetical protein